MTNSDSNFLKTKSSLILVLLGIGLFSLAVFAGVQSSYDSGENLQVSKADSVLVSEHQSSEDLDESESLEVPEVVVSQAVAEPEATVSAEAGTNNNKDTQVNEVVVEDESDQEEAVFDENEMSVAEPVYKIEIITLAGGCFWCVEGALQDVEGVIDAVSGYSGGKAENANYLAVSKGKTDHREVVQITYDANVVSIQEILNLFWATIDPTDEGGQFADRGFQYTTAIYYHTDEQKQIAEVSKASLASSGLLEDEVATVILPFESFYRAESYHQDYYLKSAERYKRYEKASGRAGFVEETWARDDALSYFEEQLGD